MIHVGERVALLERSKGPVPLLVPLSLSITVLSTHVYIGYTRFNPCTGCSESYRPVLCPDLVIINGIHAIEGWLSFIILMRRMCQALLNKCWPSVELIRSLIQSRTLAPFNSSNYGIRTAGWRHHTLVPDDELTCLNAQMSMPCRGRVGLSSNEFHIHRSPLSCRWKSAIVCVCVLKRNSARSPVPTTARTQPQMGGGVGTLCPHCEQAESACTCTYVLENTRANSRKMVISSSSVVLPIEQTGPRTYR